MKKKFKRGFTLIELSIAIAFVSILLIIVALVTDDVISSYRKGVAMKSINTIGLNLVDEFTNAISQSPATNFSNLCGRYKLLDRNADEIYNSCVADDGDKFIYQSYRYGVRIKEKDVTTTLPTFGAFCTGKYSYIWNTGYALNGDLYVLSDQLGGGKVPQARLVMKDGNNRTSYTGFRLLKVNDATRSVCETQLVDNYDYMDASTTSGYVDFEVVGSRAPEELLTFTSEKSGLALYDFSVFHPAQDTATNHLYYSASMILGTVSDSINIAADSDRCLVPDNFKSDYNYCAVNKINFAIRATGGV